MYEFLDDDMKYENLNIYQKHKADWLEEEGDRYAPNTKRAYWIHLNSKANFVELSKGKDLYDFDKNEIIKLVKYTPTKSPSSKPPFFTAISMYIAWACKRGYNYVGNPCDTIDTKEIMEINELAKKEAYQSLQEFYDFILGLDCTNVDRAMLTLLRYGANVNNVGTIKWEDVDRENKVLNIHTNDVFMQLPIDNTFIERIDLAKACTSRMTSSKEYNYIDNGYIVKVSDTYNWDTLERERVYNRISEISKKNKINRISVPDLTMSRKYDLLHEKLNENGILYGNDVQDVLLATEGKWNHNMVSILKQNFTLISGVEIRNARRKKVLTEVKVKDVANEEVSVDKELAEK